MITPPIIERVASVVAGRHVQVTCDLDNQQEWGEFAYLLNTIRLRPMICAAIQQFIAGVDTPMTDAAVLTLAHESSHASMRPGWRDEGVTECRAYAIVSTVGWLLGASSGRASALPQESSWLHVFLINLTSTTCK